MTETPEGPIKIDLNNGINKKEKESLGLTDAQLKSFNAFLEKKQSEEKLGIIYLTKEELDKLKKVLNTQNTEDESIFIEQQARETITSSELFEGSESLKGIDTKEMQKVLNSLDEIIYGFVLKKDILPSLNEDARRNLCTGLSLFYINISDKYPKSQKIIKEMLKVSDNPINIVDFLQSIVNDDGQTNAFFQSFDINKLKKLSYNQTGEKNEIFMNPLKAKEFFEKVMEGEDAQELINDAEQDKKIEVNINEEDKKQIKKIGDKLGAILKTGASTGIIDQLSQNKEEVGKAINKLLGDSHPSVIEFLKDDNFFSNFIRKILEMFDIDLDTAFNKSVVNKIKERFTKQIQDNEFNDLIIEKNSLDDSFYENLDNDKLGGLTYIKKIAELQGQKVYSKKFLLNLFNKKGLLEGKKILTDGKLDYDKFTTAINEIIKTEEAKVETQDKEKNKTSQKKK